MKTTFLWIKGIIAAFIGGAAGAVTNTLVAPETFNIHAGLDKLLQVAAASGFVAVCFYLKGSPLPDSPQIQIANKIVNQ